MLHRRIRLCALALLAVAAGAAQAQTVATGAGRGDELTEAQRIDAYLADTSGAPIRDATRGASPAEAAASARALPPMAPDSPWARGLPSPTDRAAAMAAAAGEPAPCDHRVHGEVGGEIGTGGMRGGYGVASVPVGKSCEGQVTVGVGSFRGPRVRGWDGRGWDGRGGDGRTVDSLSLGFGWHDLRAASSPDGPPPPVF
jgi:hypothetical protein